MRSAGLRPLLLTFYLAHHPLKRASSLCREENRVLSERNTSLTAQLDVVEEDAAEEDRRMERAAPRGPDPVLG